MTHRSSYRLRSTRIHACAIKYFEETRSNREKQAYLYLADNAFAQMEGASAEELQGMKRKAEEMRKRRKRRTSSPPGRPIRENPSASPGGD